MASKDGGIITSVGASGTLGVSINSQIWHPMTTAESGMVSQLSSSLLPPMFTVTESVFQILTWGIAGVGTLMLILGLLMYGGKGSGRALGVTIIVLSIALFFLGGSTYLFGVVLGVIGGAIGIASGRSPARAAR